MTSRESFLRRVQQLAAEDGIDLQRQDRAEAATAGVFHALHDELTTAEGRTIAADLSGPLERMWQEPWENSWLYQVVTRLRGPNALNREDFFQRVRHHMGTMESFALRKEDVPGLVAAVFTALRERLPKAHANMVARELPPELRDLWLGGAAMEDVAGTNRLEQIVGAQTGIFPEGSVGEVPRGEWLAFLAGLSAHYQTSPVRITIEQRDGQCQDLVTRMPLIGMEPEIEPDGIRAIDVVVGDVSGARPEHLLHRAEHPARLLLQVNEAGYARLLDIEQEDGTRTLIRFAA
jgi:uncharacterized protein (DUF2267 family)